MMRRGTVLEVLTWTYRDELVKRGGLGFGEAWGSAAGYAELGGVAVSSFNMRGPNVGPPHADALAVADAVDALGPLEALRPGADPLAEARGLARHFVGPMAACILPQEMEKLASRLARPMLLKADLQSLALNVLRPPGPEAWAIEPAAVNDANGKPVAEGVEWRTERVRIGGKTAFRKVMTAGACPVRWSPSPYGVVCERLRWAALCQGAEALELALRGRLALWRVEGTGLPLEPWRADVHRAAAARVLADLSPPAPVDEAGAGRRTARNGA